MDFWRGGSSMAPAGWIELTPRQPPKELAMHAQTITQRPSARQGFAAGSQPGAFAETFNGAFDLRDALRGTIVRESTFVEFRAALLRYRQQAH
jgi:hypothetical protein